MTPDGAEIRSRIARLDRDMVRDPRMVDVVAVMNRMLAYIEVLERRISGGLSVPTEWPQ